MIQETQEAVVDYCRSDRSLYRHLLSMNDDRFKRSVHDECSTITIHVYRLQVLLHAFSKAVDLREFKMCTHRTMPVYNQWTSIRSTGD